MGLPSEVRPWILTLVFGRGLGFLGQSCGQADLLARLVIKLHLDHHVFALQVQQSVTVERALNESDLFCLFSVLLP